MKGKLIHTEHRSSDISEYYFNISTMLITEVKNMRFNKIKEYKYTLVFKIDFNLFCSIF